MPTACWKNSVNGAAKAPPERATKERRTFLELQRAVYQNPPLRLFFVAALPGAISMLASALYQLIDGILVGQYLGDTAFAALNLGHAVCHH